jgi:hypothetical protein
MILYTGQSITSFLVFIMAATMRGNARLYKYLPGLSLYLGICIWVKDLVIFASEFTLLQRAVGRSENLCVYFLELKNYQMLQQDMSDK